jgi:uncharacterized membrane protein (DUF4010 family)
MVYVVAAIGSTSAIRIRRLKVRASLLVTDLFGRIVAKL